MNNVGLELSTMKKTFLTGVTLLSFGLVQGMIATNAFDNKCKRISEKTGISAWEIKQFFTESLKPKGQEVFGKVTGLTPAEVNSLRDKLTAAGVINISDNTEITMTQKRTEEVVEGLLRYFNSTGEITVKKITPHAYTIAKNACVLGSNGVPVSKSEQIQVSDIYRVIEKQVIANLPSPVYSLEAAFSLELATN
jgi:preprotein translocase subunit Sec61beta